MKLQENHVKYIQWLSILLWSLCSAVICWLILFFITGEKFVVVRFISYIAPWLIAILLIFVAISLLIKKQRLATSLFILALLLSFPYIPLFIPSQRIEHKDQSVYKVMTYSKMGRNGNIRAVADVIISEKPDILFMQEISGIEARDLIKYLKPHYQGKLSYNLAKELTISRFMIEPTSDKNDNAGSIIIKLPEYDVRAWNVHLQKSFFKTDGQYKQVERLAEQISHEQHPILVAGDFNATILNHPYIKIREHLDNAFEQAGFGFGFTFPSPERRIGTFFRLMRIDHIFFSKHFEINRAYVVNNSGGSDHYPVVAIFSIKK